MFTGIIEGLGTLVEVRSGAQAKRIVVATDFDLAGTRIGDSIAVNGVCLTAVSLNGRRFAADVSPETVAITTFGAAQVGQRVNLERALRLSDRLDGHLVSGHIDGAARLVRREKLENAILLSFGAGSDLLRYMIFKGSVAVSGVSLTINHCDGDGFQVSIIPHTAALTTLGELKPGDAVNIETDLIGKYVERFLTQARPGASKPSGGVTWELLAKSGFAG
jgi:riboflavin synthase